MAHGCGMDAIQTADHIVLPAMVKQHTAVDAIAIRGGTDFHGQIPQAGMAFALDVQGRFARVCFKKFGQVFNVYHRRCPYPVSKSAPFDNPSTGSRGRLMGRTASPFNHRAEKEVHKEAKHSAHTYSIAWRRCVNAENPTAKYLVKIHTRCPILYAALGRTFPWHGRSFGQKGRWPRRQSPFPERLRAVHRTPRAG